jgi:hypothetical protein
MKLRRVFGRAERKQQVLQTTRMQSHSQHGAIRRVSSVRGERGAGLISHGVPFMLSAETPALLGLMRRQAPHGSVSSERLPADVREVFATAHSAEVRL